MKKNIGKRLKDTKAITLIALVITIIVLLILAGVSLSMVLSQDGIFSRAEQATDKYGQAKAREILEIALSDAQMQKYTSGLTETELDNKIAEVGSLLPKEDENSKYQLVIVEGYIFEIDRSVPKIVDYKGPADGVIITARITQNGDWKNPVATVTGTITKYGGGAVTSSTAAATEGVTITGFPTTGGSYTIPNITKDTDITITASADDGKPAVTKTIKVRLVRDITGPTISNQSATLVEEHGIKMKIKISANAVDNESGLASLTYSVSPATVKDNKATGNLTSGEETTIETTTPGNYIVTFTAKDNANNTSTATAGPVTTTDAMSIADLKKNINADNYPDYIGTKVNYKPDDTVAWRVFYYDPETTSYPKGYFGDGDGTGPSKGTIYLKRDYDTNMQMDFISYANHAPADGGALMRQLSPDWANSANGKKETTNWLENEHCASWLCDSSQSEWTKYKTSEAKYVIGAAPAEMWTKAYNAYLRKYEPSKVSSYTVNCGIQNTNGYGWGLNGGGLSNNRSISIDMGIEQSKVIANGSMDQWLASPSSYGNGSLCTVYSGHVADATYGSDIVTCPVICLNH